MDAFSEAMLQEPMVPAGQNIIAELLRHLRDQAPPILHDPLLPPLVYDDIPDEPSTAEIIIDAEMIRGLLTRDFISRKTRCWPLLNDEEMDRMLKFTSPYLRGMMTTITTSSDLYFVGRVSTVYDASGNCWHTIKWPAIEARAIDRLEGSFPLTTRLLENFHGRLIAAGGAVTKALTSHYCSSDDIDFFFIDPDVENDNVPDDFKQAKATDFLLEVVEYLVDQWLNHPSKDNDTEDAVAYVFRGEFVTTVWLSGGESEPAKYQFIHRVYPSIGSVLGGFDLGPAMVAFTGRKIVATEMGAWSALAKTIIVDVSRRSTSFEHRLIKYGRVCNLIFVGLGRGTQPVRSVEWQNAEAVDELIRQTIVEKGFRFGEGYDGIDLLPVKSDYSEDSVRTMLYEKAAEYGYGIVGSVFLQSTHVPKLENGKAMSNEDLKISLRTLAYERGFKLDVDALLQSHRTNYRLVGQDSRDVKYYRDYMRRRKPVLQLAKLEIFHDPPAQPEYSYSRAWNLRVRLDVKYTTTMDYDHQIVFWQTHGEAHVSDYEDKKVYPDLIVAANLTTMANSKDLVTPVVAILCFKNSSVEIYNRYHSTESLAHFSVEEIKRRAINLDGKKLLPILRGSLQDPQVGDCLRFLEENHYRMGKDGLKARMPKQIEAAKLRLMGIRWILRNPGTQWTSSINPIVKDPRDWYGEYYRSYRIGNQDMETCLRLARLRPGNPFTAGMMGRDVFNIILRMAVWQDSLR